jgi:hypothetical protein
MRPPPKKFPFLYHVPNHLSKGILKGGLAVNRVGIMALEERENLSKRRNPFGLCKKRKINFVINIIYEKRD